MSSERKLSTLQKHLGWGYSSIRDLGYTYITLGKYVGELKSGNAQGRGLVVNNNLYIQGVFNQNELDFSQKVIIHYGQPEIWSYVGNIDIQLRPHGAGLLMHDNVTRTGQFYHGLQTGKGVIQYTQGIKGEGEFDRNTLTHGTWTWTNESLVISSVMGSFEKCEPPLKIRRDNLPSLVRNGTFLLKNDQGYTIMEGDIHENCLLNYYWNIYDEHNHCIASYTFKHGILQSSSGCDGGL